MKTGGLSRERLVRLRTSMTGYVERGEVLTSARVGGFRRRKWLVEECWSSLLPGFSEMLDASRTERK